MSTGSGDQDIEEVIQEAKIAGFEIIRSTSRTLLLDIDNDAAELQYKALQGVVKNNWHFQEISRWKSKSGNTHILMLTDRDVDVNVRYGLQLALGSDPLREVLSMRRVMRGVPEPSLLFKPKA